jgi:hypothetical protein
LVAGILFFTKLDLFFRTGRTERLWLQPARP